MNPTNDQLGHMAHLINDYDNRRIGDIMRDVWDYVAGQLEERRRSNARKAAAAKAKRTRAENDRLEKWKRDHI